MQTKLLAKIPEALTVAQVDKIPKPFLWFSHWNKLFLWMASLLRLCSMATLSSTMAFCPFMNVVPGFKPSSVPIIALHRAFSSAYSTALVIKLLNNLTSSSSQFPSLSMFWFPFFLVMLFCCCFWRFFFLGFSRLLMQLNLWNLTTKSRWFYVSFQTTSCCLVSGIQSPSHEAQKSLKSGARNITSPTLQKKKKNTGWWFFYKTLRIVSNSTATR